MGMTKRMAMESMTEEEQRYEQYQAELDNYWFWFSHQYEKTNRRLSDI